MEFYVLYFCYVMGRNIVGEYHIKRLVFVYIFWYQHILLEWHHPKCTDTIKA